VQPWRFEIVSDTDVDIHIDAGGTDNVYEFDNGRPTWISCGCLIETLRVAASAYQRALTWTFSSDGLSVHLRPDPSTREDVRFPYVTQRSVDRRPYRTTPLSSQERAQLEKAVGPHHRVVWFESVRSRWRMARLSAMATNIRLRLPETYPVHRDMLDWTRDHSPTGIPARATGLDAMTRRVMRWALNDWARVRRMNKVPGSLWPMQAQMDLLPGMACAAYFIIEPTTDGKSDDNREKSINLGAAFQRFWLEASRLNLAMQPNFAPQCFAYHGAGLATAESGVARRQGASIQQRFREIAGREPDAFLAVGRIGRPTSPNPARSTRSPLRDLITHNALGETAESRLQEVVS
jgi:hypothetical protein